VREQLALKFRDPMDIGKLRTVLEAGAGFKDATIQRFRRSEAQRIPHPAPEHRGREGETVSMLLGVLGTSLNAPDPDSDLNLIGTRPSPPSSPPARPRALSLPSRGRLGAP